MIDINAKETIPDIEFHMHLPPRDVYKDLTNEMTMPKITMSNILDYYAANDKGFEAKYKDLYLER